MKVILIKDVQNLGHAGDIKEVAGGYANNFLIPGGYAKIATEGAIRKAEELKAERQKNAEDAFKAAKAMAEKLHGESVAVKAKADESKKLYAAIKGEEIAAALQAKGFEVGKENIVIEEPIKEIGEFEVTVNLEHGLEEKIGVTVEAE